ncbi:hypothetical protein [Nonomuraea cavernae]|uniref:Uncharacterized protein n=1 Tax=Nonomuraea cavernae TaxID=2045107 RepID=A0A917ZH60_9ACTN|nr:hypothetical protein [Nonomuraea cavernae]MCA2189524.1 hypothetical protein [Nonomuraea cavernae]GGO81722.1 hypothetical protein GCM10012289_71350 [Nonomuraea cavernae]
MLYVFGFERIGVVVSDLYFVDPEPDKGQEGPERGVRLEVRMLRQGQLKGSIYSARPIEVDQPVWRVDLLESVAGQPGSFDRTHHHPTFTGWEPGSRVFERELSGDPLGWLAARLTDLDGVLERAGIERDDVIAADVAELRASAPEILDSVERLLTRVRKGELGRAPTDEADSVRASWL